MKPVFFSHAFIVIYLLKIVFHTEFNKFDEQILKLDLEHFRKATKGLKLKRCPYINVVEL